MARKICNNVQQQYSNSDFFFDCTTELEICNLKVTNLDADFNIDLDGVTIDNNILNNPTINGGTINNATLNNPTLNNAILNGNTTIGSCSPDTTTNIHGNVDFDCGTIDFTGATVTGLPSGPAGYTDEQAQDAVGTILTDTNTINFTYNDSTPSIIADVNISNLISSDAGNDLVTGVDGKLYVNVNQTGNQTGNQTFEGLSHIIVGERNNSGVPVYTSRVRANWRGDDVKELGVNGRGVWYDNINKKIVIGGAMYNGYGELLSTISGGYSNDSWLSGDNNSGFIYTHSDCKKISLSTSSVVLTLGGTLLALSPSGNTALTLVGNNYVIKNTTTGATINTIALGGGLLGPTLSIPATLIDDNTMFVVEHYFYSSKVGFIDIATSVFTPNASLGYDARDSIYSVIYSPINNKIYISREIYNCSFGCSVTYSYNVNLSSATLVISKSGMMYKARDGSIILADTTQYGCTYIYKNNSLYYNSMIGNSTSGNLVLFGLQMQPIY